MLALIDGDIVAWRTATSTTEFQEAVKRANELVYNILQATNSTEYRLILSNPVNFRKSVYPEYKGQRPPTPDVVKEMKQYLLESRFTLRSQLPELVKQELWGILLAYNLLRYKMILMAKSLDGIYPCQLSFREASSYIIFKLCQLPMSSPGNIPSQVFEPEKQARQFILEGLGRERCYPRELKCSKNGYALRKRNADHLK